MTSRLDCGEYHLDDETTGRGRDRADAAVRSGAELEIAALAA